MRGCHTRNETMLGRYVHILRASPPSMKQFGEARERAQAQLTMSIMELDARMETGTGALLAVLGVMTQLSVRETGRTLSLLDHVWNCD